MKLKPKMLFAKIVFYIFIIYFSVSLIVYFYQRNLLYHPGENNYLDEGPLSHKVEKVNIINVKGKTKRTLKNKIRKKSDWKKAYVFLKEGNQIDLSVE